MYTLCVFSNYMLVKVCVSCLLMEALGEGNKKGGCAPVHTVCT